MPMNARLTALAAMPIALSAVAADNQARRPNILVIMTDDHAYQG